MPRAKKYSKKRKATRKVTPKSKYVLTHVPQKGPEIKFIRPSNLAAPLTVPGLSLFNNFILLNSMVQGTSTGTRIGGKVNFINVEVRATYYPGIPTSGNTPNSQVRFVMVYDKQTNGANPVLFDLFGITAPQFCDSFNPNSTPERFLILFDHICEVASSSDDADREVPVSFVLKKKVKLQTLFVGNAGNVTDITIGGIFYTVANNATVTSQIGSFEATVNL